MIFFTVEALDNSGAVVARFNDPVEVGDEDEPHRSRWEVRKRTVLCQNPVDVSTAYVRAAAAQEKLSELLEDGRIDDFMPRLDG
jgi:hypothetical protein